MKRFMIIAIWIGGLFLLLLLTVPLTTAQQTGATLNDVDQIKQLQAERVKDLTNLVQIMMRLYEQGKNSEIRQVISAETELINAQLDMTDNPKDRITLFHDQLKLIKTMLDLTEQRVRGATGSEVDVFWARSFYLKIQIDLLKERQKLKAASSPNQ